LAKTRKQIDRNEGKKKATFEKPLQERRQARFGVRIRVRVRTKRTAKECNNMGFLSSSTGRNAENID
jgi:hypothetical protein